MNKIHDIYDRISKRCMALSTKCTIQLVNGLYGTTYPLDSEVTYNWTENIQDDLKKTLADAIVTINRKYSYHMEMQMTKDEGIVFRVMSYGFNHAIKSSDGMTRIVFPEPIVVYLDDLDNIPEYHELIIDFGKQGEFIYTVPSFQYLKKTMEELDEKKLIVFIPFQLLKLKKVIAKERTAENMEALKRLVQDDIIKEINKNEQVGNITFMEAQKLKSLVLKLYHHIYDEYEELEKAGINDMVEEALVLDIDIIEQRHKEEKEALVLDIDRIEQRHKEEKEALVLDIDRIEQRHKEEKEALVLDIDRIEQRYKKEKEVFRMALKGIPMEEISGKTGFSIDELQKILE